jgi:hypothetical protein
VADSFPASNAKAWVFEDHAPPSQLFIPTHGCNGGITSLFFKNIETTIKDMIS